MKGEIVTIVSMMGELVGRLKEETTDSYVLEDPRLFVPSGDGQNGGFSPGLCMTGKIELTEAKINKAVVLTVVPSHKSIEDGWRQATSGIVVS